MNRVKMEWIEENYIKEKNEMKQGKKRRQSNKQIHTHTYMKSMFQLLNILSVMPFVVDQKQQNTIIVISSRQFNHSYCVNVNEQQFLIKIK